MTHGVLVLSIVAILLSPSRALATQTVGTLSGAVQGVVSDDTGAVLPGVTVEISGESLMGRRTFLTDREGQYRFPSLPPGEYTLVFALEGFGRVTREAFVGVGVTRTVNVALSVAALNERVTVRARSSTIDSQSTTVTTHFDAHRLDALPSSRSIQAILAATPGVHVTRFDVGGNTAAPGGGTGMSTYGISGGDRPTVEGIYVAALQPLGFSLNYGAFAEISVSTAAHSAEWPAPGLVTQFVGKSGGNQYRGTLYADYENGAWQSFNIDREQIGRGAAGGEGLRARDTNRLSGYRDLNADVGGYVRRDAVWWYSSFRDQNVAARFVNFPVRPHQTHLSSYTGKLIHRITRNHSLIGDSSDAITSRMLSMGSRSSRRRPSTALKSQRPTCSSGGGSGRASGTPS